MDNEKENKRFYRFTRTVQVYEEVVIEAEDDLQAWKTVVDDSYGSAFPKNKKAGFLKWLTIDGEVTESPTIFEINDGKGTVIYEAI